MGNPVFFYYPSPNGARLHQILLEEPLAEMFTEFDVDSATAVGFDGSMYRSTGVHREMVTIQRDRMKLGEDLAIKFAQLQNHLDRGYSVSFSSDSDKCYCYPLSLLPAGGDHQINVSGDPWRGFTGGAVPAEGDYITIESQQPSLLFEQHKIAAYNTSTPTATMSASIGGTMNISPSVAFSHVAAAWARWYRFYPVLKRPNADVGRNIITNEGGRLFTLNLRLVVDYQVLFSHHPDVGEYRSQEPQWGSGVGSFTGTKEFLPDAIGTITLDNSTPSNGINNDRGGHPNGPQSGASNLIYPTNNGLNPK